MFYFVDCRKARYEYIVGKVRKVRVFKITCLTVCIVGNVRLYIKNHKVIILRDIWGIISGRPRSFWFLPVWFEKPELYEHSVNVRLARFLAFRKIEQYKTFPNIRLNLNLT